MERTIIIGDIHGCHRELLDLLDLVGLSPGDTLVSVGDIVDRGPESVAVFEFFRDRPEAIVLMGNHERKHVRGVFSYSQEITRAQLGDGYTDAVRWMTKLPYWYETDDVIVVHGGFLPGVALAEQKEEVLCSSVAGEKLLKEKLGGRDWHEVYAGPKPIVFGHHTFGPEPVIREGLTYGIDTGACHGLRLTALSVPDFKLYSVAARTDHWQESMRTWQLPVLRAKPWRTTSWKSFAEKLAEHADAASPEARRYLDALAAWSASLQAGHARLRQAVIDETARILSEGGELKKHPASALMYQARAGKLELAAVRGACPNPARTLELAAALGVTLEGGEEPRP